MQRGTECEARSGDEKKQVVETTCESHEKISVDNYSCPEKLPSRTFFFSGIILMAKAQ
jgi:hypothetical protein